jgi:haloalkane dehalogenase
MKPTQQSAAMAALRTPDSRFDNLPAYDFEAHYADIDGLRMHYVDEGPRDGQPVLLLHGEPSWSYLYRHMIPPLAEAGLRVIAPDLIGFGKSDKPARKRDYSYAVHVDWMRHFIESLDLSDITLFCQDWGSLIGGAFHLWRLFALFSPWFPIGRIIQSATITELSDEVVAAYDAPFPSGKYKAAARAFPALVPTTRRNPASEPNRAAWEVFKHWEKPFLTTFSNRDRLTRGGQIRWQENVPGAHGQVHVKILNAGHFLQEDKGPELAAVVINFINL